MILALALSAAFAQETDTLTDNATAPKATFQKVTLVDFEGRHVDGHVEGPSMPLTLEGGVRVHKPLISLRVNFDDELASSVDAVK